MIVGEKIIIREKSFADVWNDYKWDTDPELAHLDATQPVNMSFSEYISDYTIELRNPVPTSKRFAIETPDGEHIGNCSYYNINESKGEAELGIMIGNRNYWNKSYGVDIVTTLVNHIFCQTTLNRIYLKTLMSNIRAQKSFPKAGFTPYGQMSRNNYNFVVMEIFRNQWLERQSGTNDADKLT